MGAKIVGWRDYDYDNYSLNKLSNSSRVNPAL